MSAPTFVMFALMFYALCGLFVNVINCNYIESTNNIMFC